MSEKLIFGIIVALLLVGGVVMWKADKAERAEIAAKCVEYLRDSRTHADSLHARIACDQLWASKETRDAANAAAMAAAAAAGAAASSAASRR